MCPSIRRLFAVDNEGRLASPRNARDGHDAHDADNSDVANVAAVVIVASTVTTDRGRGSSPVTCVLRLPA
jgi:hypothetical protein